MLLGFESNEEETAMYYADRKDKRISQEGSNCFS